MKAVFQYLVALLLIATTSLNSQAKEPTPTEFLQNYIEQTYGKQLTLSQSQLEQLAWVLDNPVRSPEKAAQTPRLTIHPEVPRALARLYALQRFRSGMDQDYSALVKPQREAGLPVLNRESFTTLSVGISRLDNESYEVLEASAILDAVTLSPKAKQQASAILKTPYPEDSQKFLSVTATKATKIYPLARELGQKYKSAGQKFRTIYLPDSHLRHMMYNEGSLAMYSTLGNGFHSGKLRQADLDLWYYHWVANIAGFRGHIASPGSLYLTQDTFKAMNQLKLILDRLRRHSKLNPVTTYLEYRGRWLGLHGLSKTKDERLGLASLGAILRLFTREQGKTLQAAFHELSTRDQERWLRFVESRATELHSPAPTYGPALFANALDQANLAEVLKKFLPVYLDTMDEEKRLRSSSKLPINTPVSFRSLSTPEGIKAILSGPGPTAIEIDTNTGIISQVKR